VIVSLPLPCLVGSKRLVAVTFKSREAATHFDVRRPDAVIVAAAESLSVHRIVVSAPAAASTIVDYCSVEPAHPSPAADGMTVTLRMAGALAESASRTGTNTVCVAPHGPPGTTTPETVVAP